MATNTAPYDYGLGRRKSATARARRTAGKGKVTINGKSASDYLSDNKTLLAEITDPLALVGKQKEFDVSVLVKGGGLSGQVDAIKQAIAKAITVIAPDFRAPLKKAGIIMRAARKGAQKIRFTQRPQARAVLKALKAFRATPSSELTKNRFCRQEWFFRNYDIIGAWYYHKSHSLGAPARYVAVCSVLCR